MMTKKHQQTTWTKSMYKGSGANLEVTITSTKLCINHHLIIINYQVASRLIHKVGTFLAALLQKSILCTWKGWHPTALESEHEMLTCIINKVTNSLVSFNAGIILLHYRYFRVTKIAEILSDLIFTFNISV